MKKNLFFSVLVAAALASCTSDTFDLPTPGTSGPAVRGETPVGFSAYAERGVTRSGMPTEFTLPKLQYAQEDGGGFGVFAYYTDLKKYDQTYIPNFMYNQGVFFNEASSTWEYEPVLYWPNEYGSDAQSDDEDKVTFFAYAPYVATTSAASGSVEDATYGITGFSRNTTVGDPIVKYIASFDPTKSVDLCWAVCANADRTWSRIEGNSSQSLTAGRPWLDVEHPKGIDQAVKFTFKHALAQLNVQIDADPDVLEHDEDATLGSKTKVYVRSISFTGIAEQAALNLNNTTANQARWLDYGGTTDLPYGQSVTVKDGRRDGREGTSGAEATNETPQGLNANIIQNSTATDGVTNKLQNLFQPREGLSDDDALIDPVYVIPTGEAMTVTVVYDIETASPNLASFLSDGKTSGVSIENRVSKTIAFGGVEGAGLTNGKKYTLKLHLGMNSVKFNADVDEWTTAATVEGDGWLPSTTGEGIYNPANPLTISRLNGEDPGLSGAAATKMVINGLQTGDPATDNIAKVSAENESEWTVSPNGVVQLGVNTTDNGVRSMFFGTRATDGDEDYSGVEWQNQLTGATKILVKPVNAGTATITATDHDGNKSTIVVIVSAPSIVLDQSSVTLYKFNTPAEAENGIVTATLKAVDGITDALSTVEVLTNTYSYYNTANPAVWTSSTYNTTQEKSDNADKVVSANLNTSTGEVTITPKGVGTATVIVKSQAGATAQINVTVKQPTLTASISALTLFKAGASKSLTYTATPAEADEVYTVLAKIYTGTEGTTEDNSGSITYDKETRQVVPGENAVAGTYRVVFYYDGHNTTVEGKPNDSDPQPECVVTVLDSDPTTMKVGENVMKSNPLWKVAQYNVAKPTDGSYSFMSYHSTAGQYVFNFTDAQSISITGYKLPTWLEQVSIIPSHTANGNGTNIFGTSGYFAYPAATFTLPTADGNDMKDQSVDATAILKATGRGYFYKNANNDYYAVRIINNVPMAWHYKFTTAANSSNGVAGLWIESYVLDMSEETLNALNLASSASSTDVNSALDKAKVILNALPDAEAWGKAKNLSPADGEGNSLTSNETSLVSRFLPACGYLSGASGTADAYVGSRGNYWSSTASAADIGFYWNFNSGFMNERSYPKANGRSVRLFRDE